MNNLHRITGSRFMHEKPNLCPSCKHRKEHGDWQGFCTVKGKILSVAKEGAKGRCKDFEGKE
jgi:RNA polymerase subunit RPABC4/transcription elongation factor Spt4